MTDPALPKSPEMEAHRQLSFEQGKLRHDVGVVRAYGESHPDAWVGLRYENEPSVRIVALFTGDQVQAHEEALQRLVEHPDQLEVRWSPYPLTHLEEINAEIHALATSTERGSFKQWGVGQGVVNISLKASKESLAEELARRFGDAVDLAVGFFHYPDLSPTHPHAVPSRVELPLLPADLAVAALPEVLTVSSGDDLMSKLLISNTGSAELSVKTNGQVTARVLDPETGKRVGGFTGAQKMPAIPFKVPISGSVEIPLLVGTASFVPWLGYAVPPGDWLIDAGLGIKGHGGFRTPPLPIKVIS